MLACWPAMTLPTKPKPDAKNKKTAATAQPNGARRIANISRRAIAATVDGAAATGAFPIATGAFAGTTGARRCGACFRALVRARRREDLLMTT
jgi:hypothetical protein